MPTNRRRRTHERRGDPQTSGRVLYLLMTGIDHSWLDYDLGPRDGIPREDLRRAWEANRDWLLDLWLNGYDREDGIPGNGKPGQPGSRPWGWWEFDAPADQADDESELEYLMKRRKLLFPGELRAARAAAT